jgi:carbamoyl-phosphate synthase large subunit
VPRLDDPAFVPTLLEVYEKYGVDLLVPTIDTEMAAWVSSRDQFAPIGTTILVSGGGVVDIASDKQLTHDWLVANGHRCGVRRCRGLTLKHDQARESGVAR